MTELKSLLNRLIQGDALELIKEVPDKSVDLVFTDPPYNLDFSKYANLTDTTGRYFHQVEKLEWDKEFDLKKLSIFLFKEFDRIVKPTGSIIIFGPQHWAWFYYQPAIDNNFDLKCQIVWIKSNPIPQIRHKNYRSAHENIIWFARYLEEKCPFTFNFTYQHDMKNVFEFPILQGKERLKNEENNCLHPTQKPLYLTNKLINIHSNENDVVLDPFVGSGTTLVSCKMLKRNFIGFEIDKTYVEATQKRLDNIPKRLELWI